MRGLYVHIPFCEKKCHYCDFVISTDRSVDARGRFMAAFERELAHARAHYGSLFFDTLYFGGGTPSQLDLAELRQMLEWIRGAFTFAADAETTCEVNPGDIDANKLAGYRTLGITRVSVGIQSLNDTLLREMGRTHGAAAALQTLQLLKSAGFLNISADLILRLPKQKREDVTEAIEQLIQLEIPQIVLYDLDVHEGTAFGWRQHQNQLPLPSESAHEQMFAAAENLLEAAGYAHYAISSFAKPGFESRHNLIYWNNGEYLGLGPGAFSYMNGLRYQFARSVPRYLAKCESGAWELDELDLISPEHRELETLLTGLRLNSGVDLANFPTLRADLEKAISDLVTQGWMERTDQSIRLTRSGRRIAETVLRHLTP